ncbi:MAG TPA: DMT family transporter [Methylotenera sp.]|nr:DMT family transporter [Methylotenera sp.]
MGNYFLRLRSALHISGDSKNLPVASILIGAVFWGLLWWPLKFFAQAGLTGNLMGLTAYAMVGIVALPIVWRQRKLWHEEWLLLLLIGFFFAIANITFTTALIKGEVVRVMLLFYLLPAWGALGGVLILGEKLTKQRCIAIALSLAGVFIIMGGSAILSQPFSMVDLMALIAGLCLSATGVVNKKAVKIPMASRSFIPFIFCPPLAALASYFVPVPMPEIGLITWGLLACFAFVWLFGATLFCTYGLANIEASRASILQVTELFVAIISATLIGGEILEMKEYIGGALIIAATLIEALEKKAV